MKSLYLNFILLFICFSTYNCKAQTVSDYIAYYNQVAPKLNTVAATKSQYMGQNFHQFKNALDLHNITITDIGIDSKIFNSNKNYILRLYSCSTMLAFIGLDLEYQLPVIWVTFENEIPPQIKAMVLQYHGEWNFQFEQFFSNMIIEKIEFTGINGYDNPYRSVK